MFLRFLRQPNSPNAPRPVAKSGKAAGIGVAPPESGVKVAPDCDRMLSWKSAQGCAQLGGVDPLLNDISFGPKAPNTKLQSPSNGGESVIITFELATKSSAVSTPPATVKEFGSGTKHLLPQNVLNGRGAGNLKAAFEMLSMMTAVAAEVPLERPSISPVTVHVGATLQLPVNEKPKLSAWPADGNKPNKATPR